MKVLYAILLGLLASATASAQDPDYYGLYTPDKPGYKYILDLKPDGLETRINGEPRSVADYKIIKDFGTHWVVWAKERYITEPKIPSAWTIFIYRFWHPIRGGTRTLRFSYCSPARLDPEEAFQLPGLGWSQILALPGNYAPGELDCRVATDGLPVDASYNDVSELEPFRAGTDGWGYCCFHSPVASDLDKAAGQINRRP